MRSIDISRAMLQQALQRLRTVRMAMRDKGYAYAVRSAQECVEMSLKAVLRALGIEYPKRHDVSRVLKRVKNRFPEWFEVEAFALISKELAEKREPAMYGDELRMIPATTLFDRDDARDALKKAEEVYKASEKLIRALNEKMP